MVKVFDKDLNEWVDKFYIDENGDIYKYKSKKIINNDVTITPIINECLIVPCIGYKDKNGNKLYEYDIISNEQIKQGVIICYECTYIVMDYSENKYYFLQELNPLEVKRMGSVFDTEIIDRDGNIIRFDFKEENEVDKYE